jgi:alpha-1,2-mannosyltransferase
MLSTVRSHRLSQWWIAAGLGFFFLAIGIQHSLRIKNSDRPDSKSAFLRWLPQFRELNGGVDIWQKYNWPNSPVMAILLEPFMLVDPPMLGSQLWLIAKMGFAALSILLVFKMLDRPDRPFPFWGKALAVLLALRPIEGDLVHGNVNLFILLTVVVGVYAFHRGWDITAGLWISLGIACKVTPALFLPYFVWKRAWKSLAASAVGLALWLLFVPGVYFGWQTNLQYLRGWVNGMIMPFVVKNEIVSEHQNQSLPGLSERMLRHRPSITRPADDRSGYEAVAFHNIADWSSATVGLLIKGALAAFALCVMWRCRAPLNDRTDSRWVAEFGVVVLGMLLFSERTWKHHAVTLMIPFAVLAYQLSAVKMPLRTWRYLMGTTVAVVLLMLTTTSGIVTLFGVPDEKDMFGKYAQVYGAYTWSFALLLAAMFTVAGREDQAEAQVAERPVARAA